ncbi:hypothetical protein PAPYR_3655 [Paratrimastix pyriformis]|uniref:Uncharacterized protein n=1 Tax=Paratrimastix pyriformis TaxID=342808 RepID=A0ABQ8UM53_9EUKA|nr:hypothetical protein PAPYR_3655 [Paratrimastix pyriformis]
MSEEPTYPTGPPRSRPKSATIHPMPFEPVMSTASSADLRASKLSTGGRSSHSLSSEERASLHEGQINALSSSQSTLPALRPNVATPPDMLGPGTSLPVVREMQPMAEYHAHDHTAGAGMGSDDEFGHPSRQLAAPPSSTSPSPSSSPALPGASQAEQELAQVVERAAQQEQEQHRQPGEETRAGGTPPEMLTELIAPGSHMRTPSSFPFRIGGTPNPTPSGMGLSGCFRASRLARTHRPVVPWDLAAPIPDV